MQIERQSVQLRLHQLALPLLFGSTSGIHIALPVLTHSRLAHSTIMDSLNQPIVIDQGSGTLKAGFAGSDHPSTYFPSYVGAFAFILLGYAGGADEKMSNRTTETYEGYGGRGGGRYVCWKEGAGVEGFVADQVSPTFRLAAPRSVTALKAA